jgi:hypothetical protein
VFDFYYFILPFVTKMGSNFYFWTRIVFLTSQVIFVPEWPKDSLLVYNWSHFVRQNHFIVMILFNKDSAIQKCFQKILHSLQVRKFRSLPAVRTMCHTVQMQIKLKHHPSGRRGFPSGPSSVSRSFEMLQLASVRTIQQPIWTTLNVRSRFRISFQNTDMGILLQQSERHGFQSGRAHP